MNTPLRFLVLLALLAALQTWHYSRLKSLHTEICTPAR